QAEPDLAEPWQYYLRQTKSRFRHDMMEPSEQPGCGPGSPSVSTVALCHQDVVEDPTNDAIMAEDKLDNGGDARALTVTQPSSVRVCGPFHCLDADLEEFARRDGWLNYRVISILAEVQQQQLGAAARASHLSPLLFDNVKDFVTAKREKRENIAAALVE